MFIYLPEVLAEFETSLSPERFATYLKATGNDREKAARLYTWNTAISAAFYGPLQALEISLRNAMHRQLAHTYGACWYDNPAAGLDSRAAARITDAKRDLQRNGHAADPPDIVAALSFGFWVALLGAGGRLSPPQQGNASYERTLWRPALHRTFSNAGPWNRKGALGPLNALRLLRNRIAHHEPVFARNLGEDYRNILDVLGWISAHKRNWVEVHCRVPSLLALPRDAPGVTL